MKQKQKSLGKNRKNEKIFEPTNSLGRIFFGIKIK